MPQTPPETPFADLDAFVDLSRTTSLALSPDGTRLVVVTAVPDRTRTRYVSALWEVDPAGERPARRLTRSAKGEQNPVFAADGSLLFTSARPDPDAEAADDAPAALWWMPAGGGEAEVLATRPGGVTGVVAAREAPRVVLTSPTLPGAGADPADGSAAERRAARKDAKVTAVLHEGYPIRFWDHDLGPEQIRAFVLDLPGAPAPRAALRDLTPTPGRALDQQETDLSADGSVLVTTWLVPERRGSQRRTLVAVDTATGERRVLADEGEGGGDFLEPAVSPDGTRVAAVLETRSTPHRAPRRRVVVLPLDRAGDVVEVAPEWDLWGAGPRWSPDSSALFVTADERGAAPVFRLDVATGEVRRLTGDRAAHSDLQVSPDGRWVYALRSTVDSPPAPVRIDATATDAEPVALPAPAQPPAPAGTLTEVETTATDGTPLRAWLVLPEGAGPERPAPLLLWIHGGPLHSWNSWSWRWNPWLMAARGYAVLLPDPRLSTGYGQEFVQRGWGAWGREPYTDLMELTDAALTRDDVDAGRTACMGGSFGGYMANWVAGHTDRFRAIVTHASLWALDQFGPTTDDAYYWTREMTAEMAAANDPSAHADAITTPVLVIHGDEDYRVPIGEGLRLWWDLVSRWDGPPEELPHKFLLYPDENHWILAPQHAKLWYETVLAFLATHVHGEEFRTPELLR
ncbi:dipeptidyl aminopeptidase/acylaminoacyl peptidase [Kineococcus xinjiangensis]|uniref:Dipeptidyl aminopeptidase/acylaminoacyl peptidase n=1 Tax=Kineococcus xinjiangensis TaxID=512762 RepID=A0A2S6IUZ1_9ACTN|nr:alpha/beta fold hydrolase [Kineococcus xinjiangensis]PPK98095.1 dipeptidyl aminopeptidase/acylaminoacyl peptidase [Kineococcus xinjiangensis]